MQINLSRPKILNIESRSCSLWNKWNRKKWSWSIWTERHRNKQLFEITVDDCFSFKYIYSGFLQQTSVTVISFNIYLIQYELNGCIWLCFWIPNSLWLYHNLITRHSSYVHDIIMQIKLFYKGFCDASCACIHRWKLNDSFITPRPGSRYSLMGGNLHIAHLNKEEDVGIYQCMASNSFGTIVSREASLHVACKYIRSFFRVRICQSFHSVEVGSEDYNFENENGFCPNIAAESGNQDLLWVM